MFNHFVWENYLKSGGYETVNFFQENLSGKYSKNYALKIREMMETFCPMEKDLNDLQIRLLQLYDDFRENENLEYTAGGQDTTDDISSDPNQFVDVFLDEEYEYISEIVSEVGKKVTPQNVFIYFAYELPVCSTIYFMNYPQFFVPYYFKYTFNVLKIIAEQFDIVLSPIPAKSDYRGRFMYYGDICKALHAFRKENNLSPYELCAFLYDFAPHYIGGTDSYILKELPAPRSAFFIGSSKDDIFLSYEPSTITAWQSNPETRAGDMIVMYLTSPVSSIDSVWRACSIGFIDPFFYYYRCTYIGQPKKIKRITQNEIKSDSLTCKMPIVRKNMQGINGVEIMPSIYNHLMDIANADVFRFDIAGNPSDELIETEKDVENKLIKPLLTMLGYSDSDYEQQLYIEIGNHNHALIPDFVIKPVKSQGHASAFAIIEAKKSLPTEKLINETKLQARSYANILRVQYSIIASKEKLWVTSSADDYSKDIFVSDWSGLNNPDVFSTLQKLIGKK